MRMSVSKRISVGFTFSILLVAFTGALGFTHTTRVLNNLVALLQVNAQTVEAARLAERDLWALRAAELAAWQTPESGRAALLGQARELAMAAGESLGGLTRRGLIGAEAAQKVRDQAAAYLERAGRPERAPLPPGQEILREAIDAVGDLARRESALMAQATAHTVAERAKGKAFLAVLIPLGALLVGVVGYWLARSINRGLWEATQDLDAYVDEVAEVSSRMARSSQRVAEGSGQQASELIKTAAAMEEMASGLRATAGHSARADRLMGQARQSMDGASQDLEQTAQGMSALAQSSERIVKIVRSIDEISFQTNLLALNAAVEAARAGEAGAGFAVVAEEVRGLAQRAARAARETQSLINDAVERTRTGGALVEKTLGNFAQVASAVREVAGLLSDIATASGNQAQGLESINLSLAQMESVTENYAEAARESAETSAQLDGQALALQGTVSDLTNLLGSGRRV